MGRAAEVVDGLGRHLVRGEEDDQLLCVRGEFERLADQPELASGGVVEPRVPALRNDVLVKAPGEVGQAQIRQPGDVPLGTDEIPQRRPRGPSIGAAPPPAESAGWPCGGRRQLPSAKAPGLHNGHHWR